MSRLAPAWNESFDATRGEAGIERGAPAPPRLLRWSAPVALVALLIGAVPGAVPPLMGWTGSLPVRDISVCFLRSNRHTAP